ncbi:metallophosphoesterase family protein [Deinococcus sp. Marseille-Q6407]|uniref:metallophosphoesterase family protein n=1 Tax=Deinococcus sp. Marseille-Q6407 TaxID=2969223 RepID=UPI0021BFB11A|nr:hypothetical protein [Deinococcus sp. Marseille-Q6407]
MLVSYGTPATAWDSLLLQFDYDTRLFRRRSEAEIAERLRGFGGHRIYLVGHMHRATTRRIAETLLVRSGPVNWPNDGDPRAAWTLLERRSDGWHVEHRRVTYDWDAAARFIRQSGAPDWAEVELILNPSADAWV